MNNSFPFPQYSQSELITDLNALLSNKIDKSSGNTGLKIISQYHQSIWRCNIKDHLSPIEAWSNDAIMAKVYANRQKYLNKDIITDEELRRGLTVSKLAPKVSVFKPTTAKYLINKYLSEYDTVFDPCAGFSGRMLGTVSLNKTYIGQDINSITVKEANNIIKDFRLNNATYMMKDSIYDTGEYECLFTCPPYANKENWHQDIECLTADEWITLCLNNYKCKQYLFVIDKTELYKDNIVETLSNKSHFGTNNELVINIRK